MMVGFDGPRITPEVIDMVSNHKVGAIILFTRNIETGNQTKRLTCELQELARKSGQQYPLIIATDQEKWSCEKAAQDDIGFSWKYGTWSD